MPTKRILNIIIPLLLCFNGMAQTFEEVALNCIAKKYHQKNIQIDTVLNNYENYLINNGYLIKKKSLRFYTFFKTMKEEDIIKCVIPIATYDKIAKVEANAFIDNSCFAHFNRLDPSYLNFKNKFKRLKNMILSFRKENNSSRSNIGMAYLKAFNKKDFNNPYIRTILLLTIAQLADVDDNINPIPSFELLPPIPEN